jgi:hypothetical protein
MLHTHESRNIGFVVVASRESKRENTCTKRGGRGRRGVCFFLVEALRGARGPGGGRAKGEKELSPRQGRAPQPPSHTTLSVILLSGTPRLAAVAVVEAHQAGEASVW